MNVINSYIISKDFKLPAVDPFLDIYSGAKFAFSLNKIRSSYTGYCLKVRRESDDVKLDIGFDADGHLDVGSIISFCGSSDGRVEAWYDQTGNGFDTYQTVNKTFQPYIFRGGKITNWNGFPMIEFNNKDEASSVQKFMNIPVFEIRHWSCFAAGIRYTADINSRFLSFSNGGNDWGNNPKCAAMAGVEFVSANRAVKANLLNDLVNIVVIQRYHLTAAKAVHKRNDLTAEDTSVVTVTATPDYIAIGSNGSQENSSRFMLGGVFELIYYDFDNLINDVNISSHQSSYYNQADL